MLAAAMSLKVLLGTPNNGKLNVGSESALNHDNELRFSHDVNRSGGSCTGAAARSGSTEQFEPIDVSIGDGEGVPV